MWFGFDSMNCLISEKLLLPLRGNVDKVPELLDLLVLNWPDLDPSIYELVSHLLITEKERYDAVQLNCDQTIVDWRGLRG